LFLGFLGSWASLFAHFISTFSGGARVVGFPPSKILGWSRSLLPPESAVFASGKSLETLEI
jgi:hypothetical protein